MSNYSSLLRDPRWQKKRLEIMERDGFACVDCDSTTATLHVHHDYYEKGWAPWEYDGEFLATYCEKCHARRERALMRIRIQLAHYKNEDLERIVDILPPIHPVWAVITLLRSHRGTRIIDDAISPVSVLLSTFLRKLAECTPPPFVEEDVGRLV